jgi:plastocyanin
MGMKKLLIFAVVVVVVGAGWYYLSGKNAYAPTTSVSPSVSVTPTPTATVSTTPSAGTVVKEPTILAVSIQGFAFAPATLTVKRGDTVRFTNRDTVTHTVTSLTGKFDSGSISPNGTFELSTENLVAGTYQYRCNIHTTMQGTIIVQ